MNNQFKGHQRFNHCPRPPFNSLESTPNLFQLLTLLPPKRHNSHELSDCDRNNDNCTVHPDKLRGFNEIHRPARSRQNKDVGYGPENGRRSPLQFHGIPREQFYSERALHERTTPGRPWRRQWTGSNRHAGPYRAPGPMTPSRANQQSSSYKPRLHDTRSSLQSPSLPSIDKHNQRVTRSVSHVRKQKRNSPVSTVTFRTQSEDIETKPYPLRSQNGDPCNESGDIPREHADKDSTDTSVSPRCALASRTVTSDNFEPTVVKQERISEGSQEMCDFEAENARDLSSTAVEDSKLTRVDNSQTEDYTMEQSFNDPEVVENGSHSYEINNIRNPEDGYCSSKEYEIFSLDGLSKYRHRISQDGGDALGDEEICCSDDSEVFEGGFDRNANFNVKDDTPEEESRFAKNSDSNGSKVFDVLNEGSLNKSGSDRQNIITNKVLASHAVGDDVNAFIEPWEVDQATPSCCSEQFKYPAKTENSESGVAINPTPCEQDLNFRDCEIKDAKDCSEIVFDEAGKECGVDVSSTKEKLFLKIDETKDRSDEEEKSCVTESVNKNIGGMNLVCDQNKITVSGTIATEINENEDFSVLPRNSCDADREKTEDCLMKEDAITTKDATIFNPNEDEFLNLPVVVDVRSGAEAKGTDGKVDGATDCENESRSKESADICHFSELSDKSTGSDHLWKKSVSLYSESNGTSQFIEPKDTFDNTDFVVDIDKPGCRDRNSNSLDIALWSPSSEGVNTDNGSEHSGSVVSSDALDEVFVETLLEKVNLSFDQKQEPNSIGKNETENGIHPGNCENKGVGLKSIVLKNSDIEQKEHCDNELEHSMEKHTHKDGDKSIRDEGLPEVSPRMARRPGEYFQCLAASHHDGGKGHNRVDFCVVGNGNLCKESAEDLKVENTSRCPSGNESIRDEGLPVLSLRAAHRPAECFQNLAASRQDRDEGHSGVDFCVVGDGNSCKEFAGDAQADNRSSNPSDSNGYPVENLDSFEACHEGNDQENSAIHRRTSERETLRSNSSLTSLDQNLDESDGENHQTCEMHVDNSIEEPRFDIINIVNLDNNRAKDRMESGGDDIEYPDKSIGDGRMLAKQVAQKALNFESNMKDINDNIHKDNEKIASFFETCLVKPVERSHRSVFDLEDSDQDHVEFSLNLEDNEEEEGTCSSRTLSADESHMETVGDETHLMYETGSSNCSLSAVDQEQDDFNSKTSVSTESFVDDVEKGYSSNSAWTCTSQETGDQSGDQNVADGGTNQEADLQTGETNLFASNRKRKRNSKGLKDLNTSLTQGNSKPGKVQKQSSFTRSKSKRRMRANYCQKNIRNVKSLTDLVSKPFEKFVKTAELLYGSAENKSKKGRLPVQTNDDVAGKATTSFDKVGGGLYLSSPDVMYQMVKTVYGESQIKHCRASPRSLFFAAKQGNVLQLLVLAAGCNVNTSVPQENHKTAMHAAAAAGQLLSLRMLYWVGGNLSSLDSNFRSPLFDAVENRHIDIIKFLIQEKVNLTLKDLNGMTVLHIAAKRSYTDIINLLMETREIDIDEQDSGGWTALMWTAEGKHLDAARCLLKWGASVQILDKELNTCLHWAALSGSPEIMKLFLEAKVHVDSKNKFGATALHISARERKLQNLRLLDKYNPDLQIKDVDNKTALQIAPPKSKCFNLLEKMEMRASLREISTKERLITSDISRGQEFRPISCVNDVDDENLPVDFVYVSSNCEGRNIKFSRIEMLGCNCSDGCLNHKVCQCAQLSSRKRLWYAETGLISSDIFREDRPLVYECNMKCRCWSTCSQRVVQHGIKFPLQVYKTKDKGWAVRTLARIPKGAFVCEYVGEILTDSEADKRNDDCYLFDLDVKGNTKLHCLDAKIYGNVSRFINHSCDPNVWAVRVFTDHQVKSYPRIAFFASKEIEPYEEVCSDYGERFWKVKKSEFNCVCNSQKCQYKAPVSPNK